MKLSSFSATLLAIALGVGLTALSAPTTAAQQVAELCQPYPFTVDPDDPSIIVTSPARGDSVTTPPSVTSPLTVTGQARTFEANVQFALFDASGSEIASSFTTAAEGGVLSPFTGTISFSVSAPTEACLWVFEESAETGEPVNVVQIALTLQPALPSTGIAGGGTSSVSVWLIGGLAALGAMVSGAAWALRRQAAAN